MCFRFFSESLERYNGQHKAAVAIKDQRSIGMLLVDAAKFKSKLIPNPLRCLDVSILVIDIFLAISSPQFLEFDCIGLTFAKLVGNGQLFWPDLRFLTFSICLIFSYI